MGKPRGAVPRVAPGPARQADPGWCRRTATGWTLAVHVQPNAKRSQVTGLHGESLAIRIAAPAIDGRANDALIAFAAELLGVARKRIAVVRGDHSRQKVLAVDGDCDPGRLLPTG